jgi:hypothetical protein
LPVIEETKQKMERFCELSKHAKEKQLQTNENNKERGFEYILPLS